MKRRPDLETGKNNPWINYFESMNERFHPFDHPFAKHVMFYLPHGVKLKGFLALKPDHKKRPLIIFRLGIFSNTEEFYPERSFFFQLFEQSPFNLLLLESLSGADFVKNNDLYSWSGFDEGVQNFQVIQQLSRPQEPLNQVISSIHMAGLSLGGHGVLFASLLNEVNAQKNKKLISSFLSFCPLVNFRDTLDYHESHGLTIAMMNYWAKRRLKGLRDRFPDLGDNDFVMDTLNHVAKNYQGAISYDSSFMLPAGMAAITNDYWAVNDFWHWYKDVKTPVLIFATKKDPIVPFLINSGRILDHGMNLGDSNVKVLVFDEGYHCSFPVAYDWQKMTGLYQSYILKYSPEYKLQSMQKEFPLNEDLKKILEKSKNKKIKMDLYVGPGDVKLEVKISLQDPSALNFLERLFPPSQKVELDVRDFPYLWPQGLTTKDDVYLALRWAHQQLEARIESNQITLSWQQ